MTARRRREPAGAGDAADRVLVLAEADYRYGLGPLRIRVLRVDTASPWVFDGEVWLRVDGVQVTSTGTVLKTLSVTVRACRIPPQLTGRHETGHDTGGQ